MFKNPPKILAHKSAIIEKNYVTPEYILNNNGDTVNLFNRYCPHRMYPLAQPGEQIENSVCKFHGFSWKKNGNPINNDRKIICGKSIVGKSGLIFKDFVEPTHGWVENLASETELVYSHACHGLSKGSWLWMMEIQADLLHIRQGDNVIHPELAKVTNLDDVKMEDGDGWILQTCSTGWWLFIYPFTFIEWSPGCLSVNYTTPNNINDEFGFTWNTQFYYAPHIPKNKRKEFETLENVFLEDVDAIEKQKGKYFPIIKPYNRLENHCVHFGEWVLKNRT
jgi:hypothetical protein